MPALQCQGISWTPERTRGQGCALECYRQQKRTTASAWLQPQLRGDPRV